MMMNRKSLSLMPILAIGGTLLLAGCSSPNKVGPAQTAPGQMGTDISPSPADVPIKNSQSTPIDRPN
jgi:hypothetical protein